MVDVFLFSLSVDTSPNCEAEVPSSAFMSASEEIPVRVRKFFYRGQETESITCFHVYAVTLGQGLK